MKTKIGAKALLLAATLALTATANAQITVGSDFAPNAGSLLDLKQEQKNDGAPNASRGLGLPRVNLTDLNNLYPMFAAGSPEYSNANKTTQDNKHIGLMVYNSNKCLDMNGDDNGVYVWDGTQWQYLKQRELASDVKTFTDSRDNNEYRYREFYYMNGAAKVSAGEWMLENLRYEPDNTNPNFTGFTHTANNNASPYTDKYWCFPQATDGTYNAATARTNWNKHAGLLYNWAAATNGGNTLTVDQGQVSGSTPGANEVESTGSMGTAPHKYVQGICPADWHVPSDRELNELERAIYNNASTFSSYTAADAFTPATWNSNWESGTTATAMGWRGSTAKGHGAAMKSPCSLPGVSAATDGQSFSSTQGGFDVLLTGYANNNSSYTYGEYDFFWSSSSFDGAGAWNRIFGRDYSTVLRRTDGRFNLFSVRCKKN